VTLPERDKDGYPSPNREITINLNLNVKHLPISGSSPRFLHHPMGFRNSENDAEGKLPWEEMNEIMDDSVPAPFSWARFFFKEWNDDIKYHDSENEEDDYCSEEEGSN
tara:strand:- start:153 stop:476 length:324 start_codon:yes stop_codon:yes gene_type:complete